MRDLNSVLQEICDSSTFLSVEHKGDPNIHGASGDTPLHVAVIRGDTEAVEILLSAGANINAIGEEGYTPLHEAVEQGLHTMIEILLQSGADTLIKNAKRLTALELAEVLGDDLAIRLIKKN